MPRFIIYIVCLLLTSGSAVTAQDTLTRFLDGNLAIVKRENASFSADIFKQNGLWEAIIYYGSGNLAGRGTFKDKNLTIRHGLFTFYYSITERKMYQVRYDDNYQVDTWQSWYENGRIKDSGKLADGRKTGWWHTWHPNGKLASAGSYTNTFIFDIPGIDARSPRDQRQIKAYYLEQMPDTKTGLWKTWHANGQIKDSIFYTHTGLKEGLAKSWYENGNIESAGVYLQDKENGPWEWYHHNNKPATTEQYVNGKISSMQCFDSTGALTGDFCSLNKPALFPGGTVAFEEYLRKNLTYPERAGKKRGYVDLRFVIGEFGRPDEVTVVNSHSNYFSQEAERLIYEMPRWEPAVSHNRLSPFTVNVRLVFNPPE